MIMRHGHVLLLYSELDTQQRAAVRFGFRYPGSFHGYEKAGGTNPRQWLYEIHSQRRPTPYEMLPEEEYLAEAL